AEKLNAPNGFKNSGIRMNQIIAQKDKWTRAELEDRDSYMVKQALEIIWSYPVTKYKPEEKQLYSIALDADSDFTGKQIAKFAYKDSEQAVKSWTDMYARVLQMLHSEDDSVLTGLAYTSDPNIELAAHVFSSPNELNSKYHNSNVQIAPGIYVWTGMSTQYKLNTLRRFFACFGADPSDLVFYMKEQDNENAADDNPERYEIRKKYWTFALPFIQEKFGENGSFSNVHATTSNWISGFFGVGGFNVTCTANYDCASVQFYLGKTDKNKNKEAFDYLYNHKAEIEEKLGEHIKWERADANKASYMTYKLEGVSVTNETDWKRMAKFHAEWSKKFCDVMLPLLKTIFPSITLPN
ncbi:MAG: DUF4268 domain-containing protein, partial [Desulfovibrionaceae bacterium]|nr:DUF4268 domain-containing protein [Desulfovibrionaceae bacterium]